LNPPSEDVNTGSFIEELSDGRKAIIWVNSDGTSKSN